MYFVLNIFNKKIPIMKKKSFIQKARKVSIVDEQELKKIIGGYDSNCDSMDVTSELASGGGTTDTYQCPNDSMDVTSELASGGGTTDTYE